VILCFFPKNGKPLFEEENKILIQDMYVENYEREVRSKKLHQRSLSGYSDKKTCVLKIYHHESWRHTYKRYALNSAL
jgi:hypothetical protein